MGSISQQETGRMSLQDSLYLFRHIFLPPKLPQEDDYQPKLNFILLDSVIYALETFRPHYPDPGATDILDAVTRMIQRLKEVTDINGCTNEGQLLDAWASLETQGGHLPIYVREQNAGILLTWCDESIHLETFELTPRNAAIMSTVGRLRRQFPGPTWAIDRATFCNRDFQRTLAHTVAKLTHQPVAGTMAKVKKKGEQQDEIRDSIDPKMVTEFLTAFVRPRSSEIEGVQILKNTREEVMWLDSLAPWKRSSLWLLTRVSLQLVMHRMGTKSGIDGDLYKQFMVFLMSSVAARVSLQMPSECRVAMNAKIGRRLVKLELANRPSWLASVEQTLEQANSVVQRTWLDIVSQSRNPVAGSIANLHFDEDVYCQLPALDEYLKAIQVGGSRQVSKDFHPRSNLPIDDAAHLPGNLNNAEIGDRVTNLIACETWVDRHLDDWIGPRLNDLGTCYQLAALMKHYYQVSCPLYSRNPESFSIMLLTTLELWIACDKSAISVHGMLRDYDPSIPSDMLQCLVLSSLSQLQRLARAEQYLRQRSERAIHKNGSIFCNFGSSSSFAVRHFNQSSEHQELRARIRARATRERDEKRSEYQKKRSRWCELNAEVDRMSCTYIDVIVDRRFNFTERQHSNSCARCRLKNEAFGISITIHEWPLPSDPQQEKSVIFELLVPQSFGCWRDSTIFLLHTVLQLRYSTEEKPRSQHRPKTYSGLSTDFTAVHGVSRIGLLSQDKPHVATHRDKKKISGVAEDDVLLVNGMSFRYYDEAAGCFVSTFTPTTEIAELCMYKLPQPSSSMQSFLFRPYESPDGPPPNEVIASQHQCPENFSLAEYKALCTMPLGVTTQWFNILCQLSMPSVILKRVETCIFILQMINQVGPPGAESCPLRTAHGILAEPRFITTLLDHIDDTARRIEKNPESATALGVLICLTQKVLSLSSCPGAADRCLGVLEYMRGIAFGWTNTLSGKAAGATSDKERHSLTTRSVQTVLICMMTFDCNVETLDRLLDRESQASILLQCGMMIHSRGHILPKTAEAHFHLFQSRWKRIAYRARPLLSNKILYYRSPALDLAVGQSWAAYQKGSDWSLVSPGDGCWLTSSTACSPEGEEEGLRIHFNLLSGEFLVDGLPLARLPAEYERHETYKVLFGQALLDVMPSGVPDMQFSCQREHQGHIVHIGRQAVVAGTASFDLRVMAIRKGSKYEFVPRRVFEGRMPDAFIQDYTHWYDVDNGVVEFRTRGEMWKPALSSHWILSWIPSHSGWSLTRGKVQLISRLSPTAKVLTAVLEPVERASKIHIFHHLVDSYLEIDVPRLRLGFNLSPAGSTIRSKQYRRMSIDLDQSLDTLVGLQTKLILVHENGQDRLVLVPEGNVLWQQKAKHVAVTIEWQPQTTTHAYTVDRELGRFTDNGAIQSKLFLCYLHALTSFCAPDPLTQRTGTEQALDILRSASIRSFDHLTPENVSILMNIAALTPERWYYPKNERQMQTVAWRRDLGFLAQHGDFHTEVAGILEQDRSMAIFRPEVHIDHPRMPEVDPDLLKRDKIRSSSFRVAGYGAESHTVACDEWYSGLVSNVNSKETSRVYGICKMIYDLIPSARVTDPASLAPHLWKFVQSCDEARGPSASITTADLQYDAKWMSEGKLFIARLWCPIHRVLRSRKSRPDRFRFMIWLATIAFSGKIDMVTLEVLASLFVAREIQISDPPSRASFEVSKGYEFKETVLRESLHEANRSRTPEDDLVPDRDESWKRFHSRVQTTRARNRKRELDTFLNALRSQWPRREPVNPNGPNFRDYFEPEKAMNVARRQFQIWFDNRELRHYFDALARELSQLPVVPISMPSWAKPKRLGPVRRRPGFVCIDELVGTVAPVLSIKQPGLGNMLREDSQGHSQISPALVNLVRLLDFRAQSKFEKKYVEQLRGSLDSLKENQKVSSLDVDFSEVGRVISEYLFACHTYSQELYTSIISHITSPSSDLEILGAGTRLALIVSMLNKAGCLPRLSSSVLVQQLGRHRWSHLSDAWRSVIVTYGCSITALQWAKRLHGISHSRDDLVVELQNPGHTNWSPLDFPESLLMEIECGFLIRDVQEQIASQMRSRSGGENAVMQLNMGEGKSSVIVPMVVPVCANGSRLARVIVARPQSRQMFDMLVSRLGGLIDRRVSHMPVSRSLRLGPDEVAQLQRMCQECMSNGGVLLIQPEHILSLKLMCLEYFITGKEEIAKSILQILNLFTASACDVVDESDENFTVKFELVYTMGMQQPLELSPHRWMVIQQVLRLVRQYAPEVHQMYPDLIEIEGQQHSGCPRIRLLHPTAGQQLFERIAKRICESGIGSLQIQRQPQRVRDAAYQYLLDPQLEPEDIETIEDDSPGGPWTDSTRGYLLLLRGLLSGNILLFCFSQKRWRVNYGPDPSRNPPTRLAVPYRAKDNPAPRSEFSHPDVVIVLTSLSYYYAGLCDADLFAAFEHLVSSDQAEAEYQSWVADAPDLDRPYHQLNGINLEDRSHCTQSIFPKLRFSTAAVDYFLSNIVFPKELKEFPHKLSASGWDIGEVKAHPTVGFSGTNDSRMTLPLTVRQLDLPQQNHTNALVLGYLLRPENAVSCIPIRDNPAVSDAQTLLRMVTRMDPPVQVVLDVGAQILELSNVEVAQAWLQIIPMDRNILAVIFVNSNHEICVLDRDGRVEQLRVSPFAKRLDACYVFLDEAHTRGIDLKLPPYYRAAATLGSGMTKDKLVQACMRMRKLGKGQSVVLCIPRDISSKILNLSGKAAESEIGMVDALSWAVSETWEDTRRSMPLWAVQGRRFYRQQDLWAQSREDDRVGLFSEFLEPEFQTLEARYRPGGRDWFIQAVEASGHEGLGRIMERCGEYEGLNFASTQLQEEQERELAPEIEQEREVQRPPPAEAEKHHLDPDLVSFVTTGAISGDSSAYIPAFQILARTSAAQYLDPSQFPAGLLITRDFSRTVRQTANSLSMDSYQRSVQWILASRKPDPITGTPTMEKIVIISPFEAAQLYRCIKASSAVVLYLYAPRQNQTFKSLDKLQLYSVPASSTPISVPKSLRIQLNLFSGQLYLESEREYHELCRFLGVASTKTPEGWTVAADGFILKSNWPSETPFLQSPLKFLNVLLSQIRKDGQNIDKTHLGKIVEGKLLTRDDFNRENN